MTMLADPEAAKRWGLADGCAFDDTGNLWVTLLLSNRVVAVTPGRGRLRGVAILRKPTHEKPLTGTQKSGVPAELPAWGGRQE